VRQEIQGYLAEALANARAVKDVPSGRNGSDTTMAAFSGRLSALRYVDELTAEEEQDWRERMRVALGISPKVERSGEERRAHMRRGLQEMRAWPSPPLLIRSVPAPDVDYEDHGGRLGVTAVDVYETHVLIRWTVVPEPDISTVFPEELAQFAHDVEGMDTSAVDHLRRVAVDRLRKSRLYRFGLEDDVGTEYVSDWRYGPAFVVPAKYDDDGNLIHISNMALDEPSKSFGQARFSPSPRPTATVLIFKWLDARVNIPLS
jgi:hypothetical protein